MKTPSSVRWLSDHPLVTLMLIIGTPLAFCAMIWVISSWQEAQAYNRLTGAHATTWDAMWVELRVQSQPK